MASFSRRNFIRGTALVVGTAAASRSVKATPLATSRPGRTQFDQFGYGDVQLLPGPMLDQFEQNHQFFLKISEDALLKPFRQAADMPAPGEDMGGWYSPSPDFNPPGNLTGYIPGHTFGQYVSGLARAYAITGDKATQQKVARLVQGFAPTISPKFWQDYCLPAYTSDKTTCGLIDAHAFAGNPDALAVLSHATDVTLPFLPEKALSRPEMEARPHRNIAWTWDESYTLPENYFLAYKRSGNPRYRALAVRFLEDDAYFDPLAEGQNVLPGQHAYSHLNALCSALQAYLVNGSEKHLRAAKNGFDFIAAQSYATGGWGPAESFRDPASDDLIKSLDDTHASFETPCGAYGHFKVARYLMRITGDSRYGDSMEAILYNTVLGAKPIQDDGRSFYYADYNNRATKFFHQDKWPCCSGTLPQVTADYGISSYFRAPGVVYVNLFVPSRVRWMQGGAEVALEQHTKYPLVPVTTLRVHTQHAANFTLSLRVPAWAGKGTAVRVNGKPVDVSLQPGSFAAVKREWKNGDIIEYTLDMPVSLKPIDPRHPNTVALLQGPLALFAIDDVQRRFRREQLLRARQQSDGSTTWTVDTSTGTAIFLPYFAIAEEKYRLYHPLLT